MRFVFTCVINGPPLSPVTVLLRPAEFPRTAGTPVATPFVPVFRPIAKLARKVLCERFREGFVLACGVFCMGGVKIYY